MSQQGLRNRPTWFTTVALLVMAFALRLMYGLSSPFWYEDERQVYLIGLRSFARGEWPYFGADVVWNGSQLAGALQALLVRWPLTIWPAPEAPFVLLNLLSCAALALLAWYFFRRFPDVPRWLVAGLLFTCPWTLNFSTHIINTSYILPGAIVFFVGFLEGMPAFRRGLLPLAVAWACMGFGLLWLMQIHMSWVVLPPYVLAAAIGLLAKTHSGSRFPSGAEWKTTPGVGFLAGAALPACLLVPTLLKYGVESIGLTGAITLQPQSPMELLTTAARVLSFSSFEVLRFLGLTRADRILTIWREPWVVPFAFTALIAGIVQPVWMAVTSFRRGYAAEWRNVRRLIAATIVLIYFSYFLSIREPQAHAFYLVFPLSAFFAFSCWDWSARAAGDRPTRWKKIAAIVLLSNVVFHAGLAIDRLPRQSLYANRSLAVAAIADRNDRYLGDRRDTVYALEDHRPRPSDGVADPDAYLAASPIADLQVQQVTWTPVFDFASAFSVTIAHRGTTAAWLDLRYVSSYKDASGREIETHEGVIKHIIQPGETRTWTVADGNVPAQAKTVSVTLRTAERTIPK